MTARTKKSDVFGSLLAAMRAAYEDEIARMADTLRPRILAGEFSDRADGDDGPRYLRLDRELGQTHPWLATERGRLVVEASSRWLDEAGKALRNPETGERIVGGWDGALPGELAGECMAHDILAVAASRGWIRPMRYLNDDVLYALRVA